MIFTGGIMKKTANSGVKPLSRILFCFMAVVFCLSALASCSGEKDPSGDSSSNGEVGQKTAFSVNVQTVGGMPVANADIYVYSDAELSDLAEFSKTDENGNVSFSLNSGVDYRIVVSGMPKGYNAEKSYGFSGNSADIVLSSSLVTDEDLSSVTLGVGDIMRDFTVMATDESEIKLSEILKNKKMVMLNFWYTTCSWCMEEFPVIEEVYKEYKDDIEIIALDPLDDAASVKAFREQNGYSFIMASCTAAWSNTFGISGYPTTILIDRYGAICVIESGAITSKRPFVSAFEHFTADNYKQKLCTNGIGDLVSQIKPTYEPESSEKIGETLNVGDIEVVYRAETEDKNAEYIWPFVSGEKSGRTVLFASNIGIDDSFAILYADVTLKAGQAFGFDYLSSSESFNDVMYVIVDKNDIYQISGADEKEEWKACYPCVAEKDGVYEIALCFKKDSDGAEGDDTVYIDNFRVIDAKNIDTATYLPRNAARTENGIEYTYVDIVLNKHDGYYHVGSENGPLLLADLMNYTLFNEEQTLHDIVYAGKADKNGVSLYDREGQGMVNYFSYASNSSLKGVCTVNAELAEMLKQVAEVAGFEDDPNEWLKICKYYEAFGPKAVQLADPIKGLATFSAYTTKLGKNVPTNYFYYDRAIIPRGMLSEFVPAKSGVYRFTSKSDYSEGIDAWVVDKNGNIVYTFEASERIYPYGSNCSIVYYMEAGTPYYINMAFWDIYATGTIKYDVEYLGSSVNLFRAAAPGYFTYDGNATGDVIYDIISGGIKPVLKNGKYYDSEDGSLIYADFTMPTDVFEQSIVQMIDMGGFDFRKSENDDMILSYMRQNDNDVEKTKAYLKKLWGESYESNADTYQLDDIFAGRYHGKGEDCTEEIRSYVRKIDKSGNKERNGCVEVDERLAEILQKLMDKFTFEDVDHSWIKVCYYYDYIGPKK